MNAVMTRMVEFGEKYEREITIAGGVWLAISAASWIPQIPIPEVPYITDRDSWMLSGAWNTIWWGFVHPALENHRKKMRAADLESKSKTDGANASDA